MSIFTKPYFFHDDPQIVEQILYILKWIKDTDPKLENMQKSIDLIDQVLNHFDDTVVAEVKRVITELYESGELEQIINSIITPYVDEVVNRDLTKSYTLDLRHAFRTIQFTGKNWKRYTYNPPTYDDYCACQGGCSFEYDGINYYAEALHDDAGTKGRIKVYKEGNANSVFKSFDVQSGHTQSVTYNPDNNCIYVPKFNDSGIYQYNFVTGALELRQVNVTGGTGKWYSVKALKTDDGYTLIGFQNRGKVTGNRVQIDVFNINYTDGTAELIDTVLTPELYTSQGDGYNTFLVANCAINSKYIFIMTGRPNGVLVYNRTLKGADILTERKPVISYSIPSILDSAFNVGELEDISVDDELNVEIVTLDDLNGFSSYPFNDHITTVVRHYKSNLARGSLSSSINKVQQTSAGSVYYNWGTFSPTIHINWSTNNNGNPLGTVEEPFKTVQEAVNFIKYCPYISSATIKLDSNDYLPLFISTSKNITFNLNGFNIGGIFGTGCNINISGGTITQTFDNSDIVPADRTAPIYLYGNCNVGTYNIDSDRNGTAFPNDTDLAVKCTNDIYARYSHIYNINLTNHSGVELVINSSSSWVDNR